MAGRDQEREEPDVDAGLAVDFGPEEPDPDDEERDAELAEGVEAAGFASLPGDAALSVAPGFSPLDFSPDPPSFLSDGAESPDPLVAVRLSLR